MSGEKNESWKRSGRGLSEGVPNLNYGALASKDDFVETAAQDNEETGGEQNGWYDGEGRGRRGRRHGEEDLNEMLSTTPRETLNDLSDNISDEDPEEICLDDAIIDNLVRLRSAIEEENFLLVAVEKRRIELEEIESEHNTAQNLSKDAASNIRRLEDQLNEENREYEKAIIKEQRSSEAQEEIVRKIRRLCEIVDHQTEEINAQRSRWSASLRGRLNNEMEKTILRNQKIKAERDEKDSLESASVMLRDETTAMEVEMQTLREHDRQLRPHIDKLKSIVRLNEIELKNIVMWRQKAELEAKAALREFDEFSHQVAKDLECNEDVMRELAADRDGWEDAFHKYKESLKIRYNLNDW